MLNCVYLNFLQSIKSFRKQKEAELPCAYQSYRPANYQRIQSRRWAVENWSLLTVFGSFQRLLTVDNWRFSCSEMVLEMIDCHWFVNKFKMKVACFALSRWWSCQISTRWDWGSSSKVVIWIFFGYLFGYNRVLISIIQLF